VKKAGTNFASIANTESVGARRNLLMMGLDDLKPGPGAEIIMSREDALAMQKELHDGFASDAFQKSLRDLGINKKDIAYISGRAVLVFEVQMNVIPKFGFEASAKGANAMVKILDDYASKDREFRSIATHINVLLGVTIVQPATLSREDALAMQQELHAAFSSATFQKSFRESGNDKEDPSYQNQRAVMVFEVHKEVIPRFGFEPTGKGSKAMKQILDDLSDVDPKCAKLRNEINTLLGFESPVVQKEIEAVETSEKWEDEETEDADVTVMHMTNKAEVRLRVPGDSTIKAVKEELAKKLGRQEIATKSRFMFRNPGSAGTALLKETEKLGSRQNLLVIGIDDLNPAPQHVPPMTRAEVYKFLAELSEPFSRDAFQRSRGELENKLERGSPKFISEQEKLFLSTYGGLLARYGFRASSKGFADALTVTSSMENEEILRQLEWLQMLMGSEMLPNFDAEQPVPEQRGETDVTVTVKHVSRQNLSAELATWKNAALWELKIALREKLNRPEITSTSRFVEWKFGRLVPLDDQKMVGDITDFLILGVHNFEAKAAKFEATKAALERRRREMEEDADDEVAEDEDEQVEEVASTQMRDLKLRFMQSGVDFATRVPDEEAPGIPLTVSRLREILLDRGLLTCAENATFYEVISAGDGTTPTQLGDFDEVHVDEIHISQEAMPHSQGCASTIDDAPLH